MIISIFKTLKYIVVLCLLLGKNTIYAQCCSANPIVGSSNIGLLSKNTIREIIFYRYNYSDTYYEETRKRTDIHYLHYSLYSYIGNIISYGLSRKITIDLELGYYLKKSELTNSGRKLSTHGLNNGIITAKYGLVKKTNFECTIGAGLKFPFSQHPIELNGVPLSMSLQPSTNAFGGVFLLFLHQNFPEKKFRLFLIHRTETFNSYNAIYYMRGNAFLTNIFFSKTINEKWTAFLQLRNEIRTRDYLYDKAQLGTGNVLFFLSPQINYTIKGFNFSLLYDIPLYRNVHEIQIVSKYGISIICTKDFNF